LLHYEDGRDLASSCDGVVLVVKSYTCSMSQIRQQIQQLEETGTRILGVILNRVDARDSGKPWKGKTP
jgi:Mrp family chromosome partitioning ATPase